MKQIGLCSVCMEFTRNEADRRYAEKGGEYLVFTEIAQDYLRGNMAKFNKKKANLVRDILLPSIDYLRGLGFKDKAVLFDMEALIHKDVVREIKKDFKLVWLKTERKDLESEELLSPVEEALFEEYEDVLRSVCDDIKHIVKKDGKWVKM